MNRFSRLSLATVILTLSGASSNYLCAQGRVFPTPEEIEEAGSAPLFASQELLELTLEADFSSIRSDDRHEDAEERPAVMRWTNPDGSTGSIELQIGTRGNFRLQRRNCSFPPLRLNVRKNSVEGTLFQGQDKVKLVVTCKLGQDYWEQYVLLEYLAYRTLNILTDLSFRVRLARMTFVDSSGGEDPITKFAFIIEDNDVMAARNGMVKVDWNSGQLDPRLLEDRHSVLVELFQYMIGNTDWSGAEMHNMELLSTPDGIHSAVPFDFDWSGLVNARYASPAPSLPIQRVRERHFRGFCPDIMGRPPELYESVYTLFREKRDEIYELWRGLESLDNGKLEDNLDYFDDFFETLESPRRIQARILNSCRRFRR